MLGDGFEASVKLASEAGMVGKGWVSKAGIVVKRLALEAGMLCVGSALDKKIVDNGLEAGILCEGFAF